VVSRNQCQIPDGCVNSLRFMKAFRNILDLSCRFSWTDKIYLLFMSVLGNRQEELKPSGKIVGLVVYTNNCFH
jgi:hypothetical protein